MSNCEARFRSRARLSAIAVLAGLALVGAASRSDAQSTECLVEVNTRSGPVADGGTVCGEAVRKKCIFDLKLILNKSGVAGCTPIELRGKKVKARGHCPVGKLFARPSGANSVDGAFAGIKVRTKRNGRRERKCLVRVVAKSKSKPLQKDLDKITLNCKPNPGDCPTTTTTTTTVTTLPGVTTTTICLDCCSAGTRLQFTTAAPSSTPTGNLKDPSGNPAAPAQICPSCPNLTEGGLYFGGAGVGVPLPAAVPDMGSSFTKIQNCDSGTGAFDIAASTAAETGSNRNCTSGSATNPEYPGMDGCLFGPPLPIPNATTPSTSTCIVNRVVTDASGAGNCKDGSVSLLDLPLASDTYLTGDIDGVPGNGIQPCPTCVGGMCNGGPNDGLPCTPGSSALGDSFPTSHDCPPPVPLFIGSLPIPFALTTGTSSKVSKDTADGVATDRLFCGFCATQFGVTFQGPPAVPCNVSTDCTTPGFPSCKQRSSGAFGVGNVRTISASGSPSGCLEDGAEHDATLASVFCIPPSYNATVDSVGDLPGPGAVTLVGKSQVLP